MKKVILLIMVVIIQLNNVEAQTQINVGTVYNFSQAQASTENYSVSLEKPGEITLNISGWLSTYNWGADYDRIYIYNDEGNIIGQNGLSSAQDPFLFHMFSQSQGLVFSVGKSGVYTISIHSGVKTSSWGSAEVQNYQLSLSAVYCDDLYELNDSMEVATLINIGETITAYQWRRINTTEVWGDEDWYKFSIDSPGVLKFDLLHWVATYNWGSDHDFLNVYNEAGTSIGFRGGNNFYSWMMGTTNDTIPHTTEMNLTHAGTYYLRFHAGVGNSTTPYKLTTYFTPVNDIYEPNDNFETATLINNNDWYSAYEWRTLDSTMNVAGDEDYYYFIAAQAGQYSITLDGWIPIYNWGADYDRMTIYDENYNPVGADPISWMMGTNPIDFNIPSAGKYYIKMHCGNAFSIDGYKIKLDGTIVSVDDSSPLLKEFSLSQNYPNPFNPTTIINYSLPKAEYVKITLYDLLGRAVKTLVDEEMPEGNYSVKLNGNDLSSGTYFYRMDAGKFVETKKLLLLK